MRLQGTEGHLCELHVLDDGLTWQLDFPELERGFAYRIDATAGKGSQATGSKRERGPKKLRCLLANSLYRLTAYAGSIQMSPTDSSVGDFTSGARFPMVHAVRSLDVSSSNGSATGTELKENGCKIPEDPIAYWLAYQR
jgi:hypothetical protein